MKFYSLTTRNLKEIYRDPVTTLLGLVLPLLFLILFATIQKKLPYDLYSPQSLTPGIIIFSFSFLIMFSATLLAKDKQSAFLIRLFTTPLKPSDYILSYILPFLPIALLQTLVCFVGGTILGASFQHILITLLLFMVVAFLCICLGVILGSLFTVNQVSGMGSILITVIGLFSGVWMDLKMVGGVFETIGYVLPFAHAVETSKGLLAGAHLNEFTFSFLIVILYSFILFFLAVFAFKRTMRRI